MIYLIWAPPKRGKTYYATWIALREMLKGKKVFSNYPIIHHQPLTPIQKTKNIYYKLTKKDLIKPKVISSFKWKEEYVYTGIYDSVIILDEAYMYFSSREKNVKKEIHTFFATNGHDGNDFYFIAQHYNRIDLILREMANFYIYVDHFKNPISGDPLLFTVETYTSEEEFKYRRIKNTVYSVERLVFSSKVATAYDCKYFKKNITPVVAHTWNDILTNGEPVTDQEIIQEMIKYE